MTGEEKQRMIHIRIKEDIHKELRKAAAEYDLTIQEIVSEAVEERVEAFEEGLLLEREKELLKHEAELLRSETRNVPGSMEISIEHEIDTKDEVSAHGSSLHKRLDSMQESIRQIQAELKEISRKLSND